MAVPEMDAAELRERLVAFYSSVDPQRLAMGLDIFSLVVWTQSNGLDALNELLEEQYGKTIDPTKPLGGSKSSVKRFSSLMMASMPENNTDEAARRAKVYEALLGFYQEKDPSKIGRLNDFVQYIMLHGLEAFNRKLYSKYGEGIRLEDSEEFEPAAMDDAPKKKAQAPAPPAKKKSPPLPPKKKGSPRNGDDPFGDGDSFGDGASSAWTVDIDDDGEEDEDDVFIPPPPPPTDSMMADEGLEAAKSVLRQKLEAFYLRHDPVKLEHMDPIVDWGMAIGEEALEEKLIQLYGSGLAPPEPPISKPAGGGIMRKSVRTLASAVSAASSSKGRGAPKPPKPPQPPQRLGSPKGPTPTGMGGGGPPRKPKAPAKPRAKKPSPPAKPWGFVDASERPSTLARQREDESSDGPCAYYELDLTGASFGMCKCGFSRLAHVKGSPEYRRATEHREAQSRAIAAEAQRHRAQGGGMRSPGPRGGKPEQRPSMPLGMEPREHVGTYLYMTTSATKERPANPDFKAGAGEKGGTRACNNFRLDMTGNSYGICECGFPRDKHNYREQLDDMDRKPRGGVMKRISKRMF